MCAGRVAPSSLPPNFFQHRPRYPSFKWNAPQMAQSNCQACTAERAAPVRSVASGNNRLLSPFRNLPMPHKTRSPYAQKRHRRRATFFVSLTGRVQPGVPIERDRPKIVI